MIDKPDLSTDRLNGTHSPNSIVMSKLFDMSVHNISELSSLLQRVKSHGDKPPSDAELESIFSCLRLNLSMEEQHTLFRVIKSNANGNHDIKNVRALLHDRASSKGSNNVNLSPARSQSKKNPSNAKINGGDSDVEKDSNSRSKFPSNDEFVVVQKKRSSKKQSKNGSNDQNSLEGNRHHQNRTPDVNRRNGDKHGNNDDEKARKNHKQNPKNDRRTLIKGENIMNGNNKNGNDFVNKSDDKKILSNGAETRSNAEEAALQAVVHQGSVFGSWRSVVNNDLSSSPMKNSQNGNNKSNNIADDATQRTRSKFESYGKLGIGTRVDADAPVSVNGCNGLEKISFNSASWRRSKSAENCSVVPCLLNDTNDSSGKDSVAHDRENTNNENDCHADSSEEIPEPVSMTALRKTTPLDDPSRLFQLEKKSHLDSNEVRTLRPDSPSSRSCDTEIESETSENSSTDGSTTKRVRLMVEKERARQMKELAKAVEESVSERLRRQRLAQEAIEQEYLARTTQELKEKERDINERRRSSQRAIIDMELERERRVSLQQRDILNAKIESENARKERLESAALAAEAERTRRLREIELARSADEAERLKRQQWAAMQLLQEQRARLVQDRKFAFHLARKLTGNVCNFVQSMSSRMLVHEMMQYAVLMEIQSMVSSLWPHASVILYGSCITGLSLPFSDIDIVIQLRPRVVRVPYGFNSTIPFASHQHTNAQYDEKVHMPKDLQGLNSCPPVPYRHDVIVTDRETTKTAEDGVSSTCHTSLVKHHAPCAVHDDNTKYRSKSDDCQDEVIPQGVDSTRKALPVHTKDTDNPRFLESSVETTDCATNGHDNLVPKPALQQLNAAPPNAFGREICQLPPPTQQEVVSGLFQLTSLLHMQPWTKDVNPIPTASIPVIKLVSSAEVLMGSPQVEVALMEMFNQKYMSFHYYNRPSYATPMGSVSVPHSSASRTSSNGVQQSPSLSSPRYDPLVRGPSPGIVVTRSTQREISDSGANGSLWQTSESCSLPNEIFDDRSSQCSTDAHDESSGALQNQQLDLGTTDSIDILINSCRSSSPEQLDLRCHDELESESRTALNERCSPLESKPISATCGTSYSDGIETEFYAETSEQDVTALTSGVATYDSAKSTWNHAKRSHYVSGGPIAANTVALVPPMLHPPRPAPAQKTYINSVNHLQMTMSVPSSPHFNIHSSKFNLTSKSLQSTPDKKHSRRSKQQFGIDGRYARRPSSPAFADSLQSNFVSNSNFNIHYVPPPYHSVPVPYLDGVIHAPTPNNGFNTYHFDSMRKASSVSQQPYMMNMNCMPLPPLPFHLSKGVFIPIDITIEAGEHKGISTCEFIENQMRMRSRSVPQVVKVVKAMLHNAGLNVPFRGGLSSYSVFLLVCVAHDSYVAMFQQQTCTSVPLSNQNYSTDSLDSVKSCNSDDKGYTSPTKRFETGLDDNFSSGDLTLRPEDILRIPVPKIVLGPFSNTNTPFSSPCHSGRMSVQNSFRSPSFDINASVYQSIINEPKSPEDSSHFGRNQSHFSGSPSPMFQHVSEVSEGQLLLHFLQLFTKYFDPAIQGIDITGTFDPTSRFFFDLSPEQQGLLGSSCWISDPLDPYKNVARPSYLFRQIQLLFSRCLQTIEEEHAKQLLKRTYSKFRSNHMNPQRHHFNYCNTFYGYYNMFNPSYEQLSNQDLECEYNEEEVDLLRGFLHL